MIFTVNGLETHKSIACIGFQFLKVPEIFIASKGLVLHDSVSIVLTPTNVVFVLANWNLGVFSMRSQLHTYD